MNTGKRLDHADMETCAEVISQTLKAAGISHAFGYPGGEVVDLIEALDRNGIEFLLTGHESTAAFMAAATGRLTGRPGVCLATVGPGACNLVIGVGCAFLDRDPLLAFSATTAVGRVNINNKQNLALQAMFAPISKWSATLPGQGTAGSVCSAVEVACRPPRGPVYLGLPSDLANRPDQSNGLGPEPPKLPAADDSRFDDLVDTLNRSSQPIGVIGLALNAHEDAAAVRRFFAATGIPFAVMPQAKGVADEAGEMFLGTAAAAAGEAFILDWVRQSDCILGLGFDPVETPAGWHQGRTFCSIANAPVGFGDYHPDVECIGSVGALAGRLQQAYRGNPGWSRTGVEALRRKVAGAITPPVSSTAQGLSPFHLMRAVREVLPEAGIVTTGSGAHKMVMCQDWRTPAPGKFIVSNGLSAMGYGFSATLAAALAHPNLPVVSLIGDGEFAMMVHELETARRLKLNPLFVVLCDRSLAVIKVAQDEHKVPHRGVDFLPVDWAKVAEGFGVHSRVAATLPDLQSAVQCWIDSPELTVVVAPVDESLYAGLSY
jgi:acetolactate synthase-1/2/3 large subunit